MEKTIDVKVKTLLLIYEKLTSNVFKVTNQQKKKIKILGRISLLTSLLLINLVKNNYFLLIKARPIKKTRTIKKVFGTIVNKDRVEIKTFLY